ncbi:hypothetical protein PCE1_000736 [Barthelona sp. PCE]
MNKASSPLSLFNAMKSFGMSQGFNSSSFNGKRLASTLSHFNPHSRKCVPFSMDQLPPLNPPSNDGYEINTQHSNVTELVEDEERIYRFLSPHNRIRKKRKEAEDRIYTNSEAQEMLQNALKMQENELEIRFALHLEKALYEQEKQFRVHFEDKMEEISSRDSNISYFS